jgi:hypothetical protein
MRRTLSGLLILSLIAATPVLGATVLKIDRRELPGETVEPMTITVEGNLVAISADGDSRIIFRGDREQMLLVDDEEKSYMVLDQAMAAGVATQLDAATQEIEAAIANLPPEQQALARRAMEQQTKQIPQARAQNRGPAVGSASVAPARDVRNTGETAEREGYSCVKYVVFEEGEKVRELWVTDWSNVEGREEIEAAMQSLEEFTETLTQSLGAMGGDGMTSTSVSSWWDGIDGMPVVTTDFEDGVAVEENILRSIDDVNVDAATFEVAENYKKKMIGG